MSDNESEPNKWPNIEKMAQTFKEVDRTGQSYVSPNTSRLHAGVAANPIPVPVYAPCSREDEHIYVLGKNAYQIVEICVLCHNVRKAV